MKPKSPVRPLVALTVALLGVGCADNGGRSYVSSGRERVYNPITKNYEWYIPDQPPTSPGATNTSRQSYR